MKVVEFGYTYLQVRKGVGVAVSKVADVSLMLKGIGPGEPKIVHLSLGVLPACRARTRQCMSKADLVKVTTHINTPNRACVTQAFQLDLLCTMLGRSQAWHL